MEISLSGAITMTARNKPDAPSFVFADASAHAFARTNARVNRLASVLRAQGVRRVNRLAVFSGLFCLVSLAAPGQGPVLTTRNLIRFDPGLCT